MPYSAVMWYPNRAQWRVIWIAAVLAIIALSAGLDSPTTLGVSIVGLAALLVWKLQMPSELVDRCERCGKTLRPEWQYCPFCGECVEE